MMTQTTKFNELLEWWREGHVDDPVIGYDWQQDTFEEAHRIFEADYQQTGGDVYVGIVEIEKNIYAIFSSDLIRLVVCDKKFGDIFEMLDEENLPTLFKEYAS